MKTLGRVYGWAGLVSPLLLAAAMVEATVAHTGGTWWQQSISLFSEGPSGLIQRVAFVVAGALTGVFSWALFDGGAPRVLGWTQALIAGGLVVTGAFIQEGLAPLHGLNVASPWGNLTLVGLIHVGGAAVLYAAIVAAGLATAHVLREGAQQKWTRRWSWGSAIGVAMLLLAFILATTDNGPAGLLERLAVALALLWEIWFVRFLARGGLAAWPVTSRLAPTPEADCIAAESGLAPRGVRSDYRDPAPGA